MLQKVMSLFSVQNFLSHSAEIFFVRDPFSFSLFRVTKKVRDKRGGDSLCRSKNFCLTLPINFVGEPFCAVFQKVSGIEEIFGEKGGDTRISRRKVCVSQCRKNTLGNPFVFHFFGYRQSL